MHLSFLGDAARARGRLSDARRSRVTLSLGAAFAALPLVASAQDVPSLPATTVVAPAYPGDQQSGSLATGITGSTLDTPFSVTRVPSDLVRDQGGTSLQDALRNVPGAQADSGFNGSHTQFFILRGAVPDSGTGSNRVLRDGVRLSNYPYVPAFVESIDVLRGPGAAIGVRSEPGGTVNIVSLRPQLANFGSISVGAGSHGARELSLDLNRLLSEDQELAARLTATPGTSRPRAIRSSVSTEGEIKPRSMRESMERETPELMASSPPEAPAATRSARICWPIRRAESLRVGGAAGVSARRTDAGRRKGREVGNGEA